MKKLGKFLAAVFLSFIVLPVASYANITLKPRVSSDGVIVGGEDHVYFGRYPHRLIKNNGERESSPTLILWRVMSADQLPSTGEATLLSHYIVESMAYQQLSRRRENKLQNTWEGSEVQQWLNSNKKDAKAFLAVVIGGLTTEGFLHYFTQDELNTMLVYGDGVEGAKVSLPSCIPDYNADPGGFGGKWPYEGELKQWFGDNYFGEVSQENDVKRGKRQIAPKSPQAQANADARIAWYKDGEIYFKKEHQRLIQEGYSEEQLSQKYKNELGVIWMPWKEGWSYWTRNEVNEKVRDAERSVWFIRKNGVAFHTSFIFNNYKRKGGYGAGLIGARPVVKLDLETVLFKSTINSQITTGSKNDAGSYENPYILFCELAEMPKPSVEIQEGKLLLTFPHTVYHLYRDIPSDQALAEKFLVKIDGIDISITQVSTAKNILTLELANSPRNLTGEEKISVDYSPWSDNDSDGLGFVINEVPKVLSSFL